VLGELVENSWIQVSFFEYHLDVCGGFLVVLPKKIEISFGVRM
jgi:hypothetical protein